jgi:glycosyltransferase involved in cell wall biosynthesis
MNILILCHKYYPSIGGTQIYAQRVAEYCIKKGHKVTIFTSTADSSLSYEELQGVHVYRFRPYFSSYTPHFSMPAMLPQLLSSKARKADIIHSVGYYFFPTFAAWLLRKIKKRPLLVSPVYMNHPENIPKKIFDHTWGPAIQRAADAFIMQSEIEKNKIAALGIKAKKSYIIPFGVDPHLYSPDAHLDAIRERYGIKKGAKVLLFIGRIISAKGSFQIVKALPIIRKRFPEIRVIMVGAVAESERDEFFALVKKLNIQDVIIFPGVITSIEEKALLYALADVVLYPSLHEQFGIVALEAAVTGTPIAGTRVGIVPQIISQGPIGLLHEFDDYEALAKNTLELLSNPMYRENAAKIRKKIMKEYSWIKIARETEKLYRYYFAVYKGK